MVEWSPQLIRVTDGEEAIAYLLQEGVYAERPRPNLVLLDLNLPRKSGFDVLVEMKSNPHLSDITVLVFSTSSFPYDRERALQLGADDYLSKDAGFDYFVKVAEDVCRRLSGK